MKQTILTILHKPKYVAAGSLVVAVAIAFAVLYGGSIETNISYAKAAPGTISLTGQALSGGENASLTLAFSVGGQIKSVNVKTGQEVHKGDVLAVLDPLNTAGGLTQAKAAYASAAANYQKVVNGATSPIIDVSKATVKTAETNLAEIKRQQDTLVANARRKLYSDGLVAISDDNDRRDIVPTISGVYNGEQSGKYEVYFSGFNALYNNKEISYLGIEKGKADMDDVPQSFGTNGLYIALPIQSSENSYRLDDRWTINIPNPNGANYASNLNAYNSALQTRDQAVAGAEAQLEQAQAALAVTVAAARPEDVAAAAAQVESARGALQIAQAAYDQRTIIAPGDGTVTAVRISAGQVATPNSPAIELSGESFIKEAAVVVPNSAVVEREGKAYVRVHSDQGLVEREVILGVHDNRNSEVLSGLALGEEVAIEM
jgi:HlyD family secretion protein